jgi:hypothetical protein
MEGSAGGGPAGPGASYLPARGPVRNSSRKDLTSELQGIPSLAEGSPAAAD